MTVQFQPGETVPEFTLPGSDGKEVSLSDFRGSKVVLFFYPKDMTPTCTQQTCDFRDDYSKFKQAGAVVIGISPDPLKSHSKFIEKYNLPFLLLADEEHKVCELYGVWKLKKMFGREYMGVERSTFAINEQGQLIKEWRKVRIKDHVKTVLGVVADGEVRP
ncbi:thioredoxin-dependent thiol peroxidase [Paenibacillus sp. J2TS4]|uniref:thioredoxin-dependent thiol peroxidase n=1 Tax=Paenibacillus sp. J2TS4 TaxID=2807194 RepID=UPI001B082FF4|nr:thioredoxin-dependent thiol peroxidase [Paenibacillus sp. J2TS4]GIP34604.1 peroxiredoxin [Paenibacillus sp. J2TS4]